jgi:hypothetical protein
MFNGNSITLFQDRKPPLLSATDFFFFFSVFERYLWAKQMRRIELLDKKFVQAIAKRKKNVTECLS